MWIIYLQNVLYSLKNNNDKNRMSSATILLGALRVKSPMDVYSQKIGKFQKQ